MISGPLQGHPGFQIMPRDYEIMASIHRFGFLTAIDVRDMFWKKVANRNHTNRLRVLQSQGLIERLLVYDGGDFAYRLTRRGALFLRKKGLVSPEKRYQPPRYTSAFNHDKLLNRILRRIEIQPFVSYIETEMDLRIRYKQKFEAFSKHQDEFKIPDGRIRFQGPSGQKVDAALELELNLKSRAAYQKIFRDYQRINDWQVLIYVVADQGSRGLLASILEELHRQSDYTTALLRRSPVYLTTLKEMQDDPAKAALIARSCHTCLEQMAQSWPIVNPFAFRD